MMKHRRSGTRTMRIHSWRQPRYSVFQALMPQSHTHFRTLTESFGSYRSRPQKNEGGVNFLMRLQDAATVTDHCE